MGNSSKVNGQDPVWKATTQMETGKNLSAWWTELHAVFPELWKN